MVIESYNSAIRNITEFLKNITIRIIKYILKINLNYTNTSQTSSKQTNSNMNENTSLQDWRNAGFSLNDAKDLKNAGFSLNEAIDWKKAGFSPNEAKDWINAGFSPNEAIDWKNAGFSPNKSKAWKKAEFSPNEAKAWKNALPLYPESAKKFVESNVPLEDAKFFGYALKWLIFTFLFVIGIKFISLISPYLIKGLISSMAGMVGLFFVFIFIIPITIVIFFSLLSINYK